MPGAYGKEVEIMYRNVVMPCNFFIFFRLGSVHTFGLSVMILPSGSDPG
jgi:hypothetical protein